ncbi:hypothetical protein AVEN_274294-1 [Araneus ventricosus]|uniref:Uncharacterized protein n=1 Tax=Araneus ventricosus TaxID=182803 RepID=A0A4Y2DJJ6_ARAVE|nr:hypothetical protein AVEN_274294-1 [Araneus ventricosus]
MKLRHLNCLAHFGDPPDGSIDVRESVYMYIYKEKIVREHLTGPQHYSDNGLASGTRGEVSRNQEEDGARNFESYTMMSITPKLSSDSINFHTTPQTALFDQNSFLNLFRHRG